MESAALSYLLQHTSSTMYRQIDKIMQERLGIGMAQFKLLGILQERAGIQQRFLADSLGQTEASISRQVKLLQEKGLVIIQLNPASKREHVITLSGKGLKFTDAAQEIVDAYHTPVFQQLSDKEHEQLAQILQHLHLHCCGADRPYACDPA